LPRQPRNQKGILRIMAESFGELLREYMRRTGIADAELARTIGVSRQTVFRWKEGLVTGPRDREHVLEMSRRLRLAPVESDRLLLAAGFAPEAVLALDGAEVNALGTSSQPSQSTGSQPAERGGSAPDSQSMAGLANQSAGRKGVGRARASVPLARGLVVALVLSVSLGAFAVSRSRGSVTPIFPHARAGESLIIVAAERREGAAATDPDSDLVAAIEREIRNLRLEDVRVARWPAAVDGAVARSVLENSGAVAVAWVDGEGAGLVVRRALSATGTAEPVAAAGFESLPLEGSGSAQIRAAGLWLLAAVVNRTGDTDMARALLVQAISVTSAPSAARNTMEADLRAMRHR
jgi:DNA-binding XRE family transcriptional regulator